MKVFELESKIQSIEGFRVVVRAPATLEIGEYNYQRAAMDTWTINEWADARLNDNQKKLDIVVLNGLAKEPQRNTRLQTVRETYR